MISMKWLGLDELTEDQLLGMDYAIRLAQEGIIPATREWTHVANLECAIVKELKRRNVDPKTRLYGKG